MARKWWVLLILVLLLAGGGLAAWDYGMRRMEQALAGWSEVRRGEGWRIAHEAPERVGFPFRPGLRLGQLAVDLPTGFGWRADRATIALTPTDLRNLHLALEGRQGLRVPGGMVPVSAPRLEGRLALDGSEGLLAGNSVRMGQSSMGAMALRLRPGRFELTADALRLAEIGGLRLDSAQMAGRLSPPPLGTARQWREAGGTLQIESMELRQGPSTATVTGGLALDAQLQPEGRGQLQLTAPGEAVRLLAEAGLVPAQLAGPLRAFVAFGARVPHEGGPPRLDIALELRDGRLSAGRLPVATLPRMEWR
jgi:hypothetical protein